MGSDRPAGPDWWQASDGKWYPLQLRPRHSDDVRHERPWTPDDPVDDAEGAGSRPAWIAAVAVGAAIVIAAMAYSLGGGSELSSDVSPGAAPPTSAAATTAASPDTTAPSATAAPMTTLAAPSTSASPTTLAPATTATPATTAPPALPDVPIGNADFGDGMTIVAQGLEPGLYARRGSEGECSWRRLSGTTGAPAETIIGTTGLPGRELLEVVAGDVAIESIGCGGWGPFEPVQIGSEVGDGAWVIGWEIAPGSYQAPAPTGSCAYARVSGFAGTPDQTIQFGASRGESVRIELTPSDIGFKTYGCGVWTPST